MKIEIREEQGFKYIEDGEGEVLLLLHGLFGALSNFLDLLSHFSSQYKVVVPLLPLYELELDDSRLPGMVDYLDRFMDYKGFEQANLLGNSLGGHIALLYALKKPKRVKSLILTGSSGLFESSLGDTYPKKGDYQYVKKKTEYTFYNPKTATKELVDEVYDIVNDREKAIRILYLARSAIKQNLRDRIGTLDMPTLLIWGKQDTITPPFVGEEFDKLMPNTELHFLDKCGHAPMMERPGEFNAILEGFLQRVLQGAAQ